MSSKQKELVSFDEAIHLFGLCLRSVGVLPNRFTGRHLLLAYFIWSGLIHCSMFVIDVIRRTSITLEAFYETLATLGIYARFSILLARRDEFTRLIQTCAELWNYCDADMQTLVMNFERKIRNMFWLIFLSVAVFINVLYGFNAIHLSYLSNQSFNHSKVLPYRWYGIEDVESSWLGYEVSFSVQVIMMIGTAVVSATVDTALPLLVILCCGYFRVLQYRVSSIGEKSLGDPIIADLELIDCCKFHQQILVLCMKVEKFGRVLFLIELVCSGYVLGLVAIKLASSDPDKYKYLPELCVLMAHIFICQWAPDMLIDESEDVSIAAYSVSYIFMKRPSRRYIILMILRSQQPLTMTGGGIVILSLQNFGRMLTSAASLFTAMRNLMD